MDYIQTDYKLWSVADTIEWIISLNSSRFEKYRETLKQTFSEQPNFSAASIVDAECEDLQQFGIINLEDRKSIYKAIIQLAVQKKRDSDILDTRIDTSELSSLSDDEEDEPQRDCNTLLTEGQWEELSNQGFCEVLQDETEDISLVNLINGFLRNNCNHGMAQVIINAIIYYHGIRFDTNMYVLIQSAGGSPKNKNYLTPRVNISLSKRLTMFAGDASIVELDDKKVPPKTLDNVLTYLSHHKGVEPDPLPCPVRSIHMKQICSDRWDADWIDAFDKKTIFELIMAANYLDIKGLLHLGCTKIATLIKQLDQSEINRIVEEEERYGREKAQKQAVESGQQESVFGLTGNDNEENGDNENNEDYEESIQEIKNEKGADNVGIEKGNNDEKQ